ncbi:hypothetical protein O4J55_16845 [Paracoccus sp. PXZ]
MNRHFFRVDLYFSVLVAVWLALIAAPIIAYGVPKNATLGGFLEFALLSQLPAALGLMIVPSIGYYFAPSRPKTFCVLAAIFAVLGASSYFLRT